MLGKKIIQVSGAQFYNTSSVHCIVCSSQVSVSPSPFISPTLHPLPLAISTLVSVSMSSFPVFFFFLFFSQSIHPAAFPTPSCQPALPVGLNYYTFKKSVK